MDECSSVLNEIVKAKKNIKRKFDALKSGEANVRSLVEHTFKPIIEPLTKISNKKYSTIDSSTEKYPVTKDSIIEKSFFDEHKHNIKSIINYWFQSSNRDKIYGPKQFSNGEIKLGEKEISFDGDALIIDDNIYSLTSGLEELLFSKNPKSYTPHDKITYKQILNQTSAHLTVDGSRIKKGGIKYENLIGKLFPSGGGMKYGGLKLQNHNLVYWNDINELVDRLRLLLASQAAGNTSLSNEILSIFEELYEAGVIKKIPNV